MGAIVAYKAISLEGYATGPGGDLKRLHAWMDQPDSGLGTAGFFEAGAIIMGASTFESGQEPWGDDEIFPMPVFVLTHHAREPVTKNGTTFTFVAGTEPALAAARSAAGERSVVLMGISVVRQYLAAGLVDELRLHLVPMLLGDGTPLFGPGGQPADLEPLCVVAGTGVTHLTYQVRR